MVSLVQLEFERPVNLTRHLVLGFQLIHAILNSLVSGERCRTLLLSGRCLEIRNLHQITRALWSDFQLLRWRVLLQ